MSVLTAVVVLYLAVTALVAAATGVGAPLEAATRTGYAVGRVGAALVVVADVVTIVRGHRPVELATHLGYVVCAVALPPVLTRGGTSSPWVVSLTCVALVVVLVRMALTWA